MRSLVLEEDDGTLFEQIYAIAVQLVDPVKAQALSREQSPGLNPLDRFWQRAYDDLAGDDKTLTSAILSVVNVPFGAYVLTCRESKRLEITPWLLASQERIDAITGALQGESPDENKLYGISRDIKLTADFLTWLKEYTTMESKRRK